MRALICAVLLSVAPLSAAELSDRIMAPGLLADAAEGVVARYVHDRHLPEKEAVGEQGFIPPREVRGAQLLLRREGERLNLTSVEDGKSRDLAQFPASGSNPVLLYFLENVVRSMAVQTGGSPFYIRNRIREALVAAPTGATVDGVARAALHPFGNDPHRAQLGDFAELTLTIAFGADNPGRLLELMADTGVRQGGYSESLKLMAEER